MAVALTTNGVVDTTKVDRMAINFELKKFKDERGIIKYEELINIPLEKRICKMAEKDLGNTINIITVALTLAFETFNITRRMSNSQVVDLAEVIVDTAGEDKIAVEDLMLFLQKLTRGEYPELYEGLDQVKFLSRFNKYRDERWEEAKRIRDERHEVYKKLGDDNLYERTYPKDASPFSEYVSSYTSRIQSKNDEIRELRERQKRNQ